MPPRGYTCTNSGSEVVTSVSIALGDDVTCTIVNDDIAGTWTISKSSDPATGSTVKPGDVITYTVTAAKLAGQDPQNVVVVDDLSNVLNHATFVSGSIPASAGSATQSGTTMTWTIPDLSRYRDGDLPGQGQCRRLRRDHRQRRHQPRLEPVRPAADDRQPTGPADCFAARLRLARSGRAPAARGRPGRSPDCTTTTHDTPAWSLVKSSDPASGSTVQPGQHDHLHPGGHQHLHGPPVTGAMVVDDLSAVLNHGTLVAVPDGATLAGHLLTWQVPTLAAKGDTATLTYQVKLNSDAYNVTVKNVATPGPGGTCTTCTTNHQTPPPGVVPPSCRRPAPTSCRSCGGPGCCSCSGRPPWSSHDGAASPSDQTLRGRVARPPSPSGREQLGA